MRRFARLPLYFFSICAVMLLGACCASKQQDIVPLTPENRAAENCPGIYLFASSRHAISLVAKEEIIIDPARYHVSVHCTPDQARKALRQAQNSGGAPASMDLQVYLLEGEWSDMVRREGDRYFLNQASILLDTVE